MSSVAKPTAPSRSRRARGGALLGLLAWMVGILFLVPVLWMVLTSFHSETDAATNPPSVFAPLTLQGYREFFGATTGISPWPPLLNSLTVEVPEGGDGSPEHVGGVQHASETAGGLADLLLGQDRARLRGQRARQNEPTCTHGDRSERRTKRAVAARHATLLELDWTLAAGRPAAGPVSPIARQPPPGLASERYTDGARAQPLLSHAGEEAAEPRNPRAKLGLDARARERALDWGERIPSPCEVLATGV